VDPGVLFDEKTIGKKSRETDIEIIYALAK
jgi:hypothetical protein